MGSCAVAVLSLTVLVAPAADAATGRVITSGVSLDVRSGPRNSFGVIGKLAPGTVVSFSCYASGDAATGPYGTETIWDRLNSGGFVPDAWIYTGSNNAAAPKCSTLAGTGAVITSGVSLDVRSGPGNSFGVIGKLAPGTVVSFSCYASGDAATGPYGTETIWDRLNSGGFVPDAWIYTGSNNPTVPQCSALPAVASFTVRGSHAVTNDGSQDTHASTPNATCSGVTLTKDEALGSGVAAGFGEADLPESQSLLLHFLGGNGKEVDFTTGTPISADALASTEFKNVNSGVQTQLLKLLRRRRHRCSAVIHGSIAAEFRNCRQGRALLGFRRNSRAVHHGKRQPKERPLRRYA